ncbi:MAG: MarR family winged helix-turn-helix transcriptional regulator [Mangrovicoccus sp.]|nr:MarR family winged helix-turn-helix transcriptional regulator [Mangrovicoccus sp.]
MDDEKRYKGQNNLRGLVQDASELFDGMATELRKQTAFGDSRPSDAKTFMLISRHPRGLTELAEALQISRQAVHKSVQRLVEAGVVEFEYAPNSRRDKIADLTEKGIKARQVGFEISSRIEEYVQQRVGQEDLETLRRILMALLEERD